jgi:hypothetical protein
LKAVPQFRPCQKKYPNHEDDDAHAVIHYGPSQDITPFPHVIAPIFHDEPKFIVLVGQINKIYSKTTTCLRHLTY